MTAPSSSGRPTLGIRIWVVEPDNLLRDIVHLALTRAGYEVTALADPAAILALAQDANTPSPALVVVDMFLPGLSGLTLMKRLRDRPGLSQLPLIAISALGFPEVVEQAIDAGAGDFILKPFDPSTLVQKVSRLVRPVVAPRSHPRREDPSPGVETLG
jgi:two-component system phosphate regulon response regulator PhoB